MNNKKILNELIDSMMNEENQNPQNYCFRNLVYKYPKAVHDAFDFPGEYVENLKVEVFTDDGRNLIMDCAQRIMPKGNITYESTINVELQLNPLTEEKINKMYDHKISLIYETHIVSNSVIITNNSEIGDEIIYCEAYTHLFKVHVKLASNDEILKRLTVLKDIVKSKKTLTEKEAMYFGYISIFVEEKYSKKIMIELSELFSQITSIEPNLELDIHQVLKKMIKEYFKDDEKKCKELLTQISEPILQKKT